MEIPMNKVAKKRKKIDNRKNMNQKNGKNSLGIDSCFEDLDNPIELFKKWFAKAEKTEINDPNAVAVATSNKDNRPNVRMVLLKGLSDKGFVFLY